MKNYAIIQRDDEVVTAEQLYRLEDEALLDDQPHISREVLHELNRLAARTVELEHAIKRALDKFDSGKTFDGMLYLTEVMRK